MGAKMGAEDKIEAKEELKENRFDYNLIAELIQPNSKVLDLRCGIGSLLRLLKEKKNIDGRGIEIKQERGQECVKHRFSFFPFFLS